MFRLISTRVSSIEFVRGNFYVAEGQLFDVAEYCERENIDPSEIDDESIKWVVDNVARLNPGEYLTVGHCE